MQLPFYGFEHVDLCTAHGDQVGGHYYVWLKARRPDADALRDRKNQLPHDYVCPQAYRTPIPEELYPTSYIAEKSCEWLDRYAAGDRNRPFFLMASFPDPHHPFTPPGRYWSMYRPQDMALPPSFHHGNRPLARPVAWALAQRESGNAVVTEQAAFAVDEREAREAMALSCGMIAMIDDAIGRILARLAASGLAERHRRDLHHRPRRFSRRSPAAAERSGPLRGDHPRAVHLGRAGHAAGAQRPMRSPARSISPRPFSIAPAYQPYNGIQGESLLPAIGGGGAATRAIRW